MQYRKRETKHSFTKLYSQVKKGEKLVSGTHDKVQCYQKYTRVATEKQLFQTARKFSHYIMHRFLLNYLTPFEWVS